MILDPPDVTQAGFLRLLDEALGILSADQPRLGGSGVCQSAPGEPPEMINPFARVNVQLEGTDCHATSVRGKRVEIELKPGQCVYFAPYAWSIPFFNRVGKFVGIVFKPDCIRLVQVITTGAFPKEALTPWAYHTVLPLGEAGNHILRAMSCFAEQASTGPATRELLVALVYVARQHLAEDDPTRHTIQRAQHTWQIVRHYLDEHFGRDVTRESVAEAMGLHPNYLSALARTSGGESFREALEGVRLHHARRLLRETHLKLANVAAMCGFNDVTRFAKAFRRVAGITPGRFRAHAKSLENPNI